MTSESRSIRLLRALLGLSMLSACGSLIPRHTDDPKETLEQVAVRSLAPGYAVDTVRTMPEAVTALLPIADSDGKGEEIYIGTGGMGGVHRIYAGRSQFLVATRTIALGLGDSLHHGTCNVNRLAISDIDHDGRDDLIAETSQIQPRGRPRLYVWTVGEAIEFRGCARPKIDSSWGHGLGFVHHADGRPTSILSTYCGYGEIVEYQLSNNLQEDGYHNESLSWRLRGQMPFSGEGIDLTDADNDGEIDLCLATGFAPQGAAIHICSLTADDVIGEPRVVIDEGKRFGTVKFLVGSVERDGTKDLFAWWCTGLGEGDTEMWRYRIDPRGGVVGREFVTSGGSSDIWPIDGQTTFADLDDDGCNEVWFATVSGNLWRYAPSESLAPALMCQIPDGIGPIAGGGLENSRRVYIGSGSRLLQFHAESKTSAK
jgi:hypothetical protein